MPANKQLAATKKGLDFITSPVYGVILRETLQACLEDNRSYNLTYMTWICKTASYLAGNMLPEIQFTGTDKRVAFATPELRQFAVENQETIEKALKPYIEELNAAPLKVHSEDEMDKEIADWSMPVNTIYKSKAKAGK